MNSTMGAASAAAKKSCVYWKNSASSLGAAEPEAVGDPIDRRSSDAVCTEAARNSPATGMAAIQYGAIFLAISRNPRGRSASASPATSTRKASTNG